MEGTTYGTFHRGRNVGGVDRFSISPVLDGAFELSSIKACTLMSDSVCLYSAGTRNSDMKMQLAVASQIPHQALGNHNHHFHFSALFISEAGVTIKTICLAITVLKIIKQFQPT